jgi:hypothetical protein
MYLLSLPLLFSVKNVNTCLQNMVPSDPVTQVQWHIVVCVMCKDMLCLIILNSWILIPLCGTKYSDQDFGLLSVRNLLVNTGNCPSHPVFRMVGRRILVGPSIRKIEFQQSRHLPAKEKIPLSSVLCSWSEIHL